MRPLLRSIGAAALVVAALQEAQHDADFYHEALATAEAKLKKLQEVKP